MLVKIQIRSIFGKVLFELEKENNTIRETLEEAVKNNTDLINANLRNANLDDANLEGANLINANLINANLINANLDGANLRNANLDDANIRNANLRNANLRNAKNKETVILPIYCRWSYGIKGNLIVIGCKEKTIEQWDLWFDSEEEYSTRRDTEYFKQIQAVYNALKSYYLTLNK